ncbi:aminotransferase class I/II-fold pyridoxal phosphate-dependent enzyme [Actinoplanes sp. NPDC089786]|uniref:aminotransferase class I/II-fold pyridoxal phosphate-dependent enzyme n=1 Tax=Actinoplanes sp. NPDC089786 TaxID=3155185 RepID=UPI00341508D9
MLTREEYLYFAGRALDGMAGIVATLGDDRAGRKPQAPGANSPYALLTHCLGVVEAWAGGLVAGRPVDRDRAAEFTASGPVAPLLERCREVRAAFHADVLAARPAEPLTTRPPADFDGPDRELTQGAALQHVYEELAQHHGQMEVLRDLIVAESAGEGVAESAVGSAADGAAGSILGIAAEGAGWVRPERLRDGVGAKWRMVEPDVLPAWVADMDLGVAPPIIDRVRAILDRQDLGYPYRQEAVAEVFEERMRERFGWAPRSGRTRVMSDLIQILQVVIEMTTEPGDGVALHMPAYPPFPAAIRRAGRALVPIPMIRTPTGWTFDLGAIAERRPKLLVVVNPQNPTGRVFTADELRSLRDVAEEYDLTVLADEIHADLVYEPHRHVPFASLPGMAGRTVTATSATKAFNIAGLRCALAHIGPDALAGKLDRMPLDYFGTPDVLGRAATMAAWTESGEWHRDLMTLLRANRDRVTTWAAERGLAHHTPEATYLSWVDFEEDDPAGRILRDGRVQLTPGADFGDPWRTHARINFATTPDVLDAILGRISSPRRSASAALPRGA